MYAEYIASEARYRGTAMRCAHTASHFRYRLQRIVTGCSDDPIGGNKLAGISTGARPVRVVTCASRSCLT